MVFLATEVDPMEEDGTGPEDSLSGARQDSVMSGIAGSEADADENPFSIELRETLVTLGLGDLSAAVRQRVLLHVGNDVARAVDWIMENGDQVSPPSTRTCGMLGIVAPKDRPAFSAEQQEKA